MIIWYITFKISQKFQSSHKNLTFNGPYVEFAKFLIVVIVGHKISRAAITLQSRKRTCYWYPDNGAELIARSSKIVGCYILICLISYIKWFSRLPFLLFFVDYFLLFLTYILSNVAMIIERGCNSKINCYYSRWICNLYLIKKRIIF